METRADCPTSSLSLPASHGWCHLHLRERGSPMKNRKREICTSGSVRDEDGQPPHLLGRRKFLHLAAGAAALSAVPRIAPAQTYPSRLVRLVVGFPAGGTNDIHARLIADWLSKQFARSFIVENRPGAAGNIGLESVVRAAPDGYTLSVCGSTELRNELPWALRTRMHETR